jgi:hypothetical protein
MSTFSLLLIRKTDRIEASPKGFHHKLTFEMRFSGGEKLTNHLGVKVDRGYVELVMNQPRTSEPEIFFTEAMKEPDSGEFFPATISFYALVPENVFHALRSSPISAKYTLKLSTDLMGAVRFNDSLGFEKVWNTEQQNPVKIPYFEFSVEHEPSDA